MTQVRPQRGRPKGTGINDQGALRQIARLITDNPKLRPTTAIKTLGISNPSIVRRLRDKYNHNRIALAAELSAAGNDNALMMSVGYATAMQASLQPARPRASAVHVAALASAAARIGNGHNTVDAGGFAMWFGLGLAAAASAIEQQLTLSQQLARLPTIASMLRQQVEMAELMMSLSPSAIKRVPANDSPVPAIVR